MTTPIYNIRFNVVRTPPSVSPTAPQRAGHYGDDGVARIAFAIADAVEGHQYRIEIEDANGAYDVTELLDIEDGEASYTVPAAWTAAGIASVRLVEIEVGDDGTETAVLHYPAARLSFEARDDGDPMGDMTPRWQTVMTETESYAQDASAAADEARDAAKAAMEAVQTAQKILVVTEQNGITSHSAAEIYEACQAGHAVFLKINNRLIPTGYGDASFLDVQVGVDGARTIHYSVDGNLLLTSTDTYRPPVDRTLTKPSVPADSFTVGQKFGDVESALDNIIAIQNNLIGGGN